MSIQSVGKPTTLNSKVPRALVREWKWVILAFAAGGGVMWAAYPDPLVMPDTAFYIHSAESLRVNPFKPIGYSLFLAFLHDVLPWSGAVLLAQTCFRLVATIFLLSILRRHWKVSRWGLTVLGVLLGLDPLNLLADHTLLSDSLFVSLILLNFGCLLRYLKKPKGGTVLALLIFPSLAILVRPVGLVYVGVAVLTILIRRPLRCYVHAGLLILGIVGIVAGTAWRCQVDLGVFATTSFDGWALYGDVAALMDRSPEYREGLGPELESIYRFFSSFPESVYDPPRCHDWYRWSSDSPAHRYLSSLLNGPVTHDSLEYHTAFVKTNEALRKLGRDIVLHRPLAYLSQVYLPNLVRTIWGATVNDLDTRVYNHEGKTFSFGSIKDFYDEDSELWRARFVLFGKLSYFLPHWVTFWWGAALTGAFLEIGTKRRKQPVHQLVADPVVYLTATMFLISLFIAASHHFHLRYATPNLPLLMIAGVLAGARRLQAMPSGLGAKSGGD